MRFFIKDNPSFDTDKLMKAARLLFDNLDNKTEDEIIMLYLRQSVNKWLTKHFP